MKGMAIVLLGIRKDLARVFEGMLSEARGKGFPRVEVYLVDEVLGSVRAIDTLRECLLSNIVTGINIFTASDLPEAERLLSEIIRGAAMGRFDEALVVVGESPSELHEMFLERLKMIFGDKLLVRGIDYYAL